LLTEAEGLCEGDRLEDFSLSSLKAAPVMSCRNRLSTIGLPEWSLYCCGVLCTSNDSAILFLKWISIELIGLREKWGLTCAVARAVRRAN